MRGQFKKGGGGGRREGERVYIEHDNILKDDGFRHTRGKRGIWKESYATRVLRRLKGKMIEAGGLGVIGRPRGWGEGESGNKVSWSKDRTEENEGN